MRDSSWSLAGCPAPLRAFFLAVLRMGKQFVRRNAASILVALVGISVCLLHVSVAGVNSLHSAAIGYLCLALVLLGCAVSFSLCAGLDQGTLRIRWLLMSLGALAGSLGYIPSFLELTWHLTPIRFFPTFCFNLSEASFLLAAVLFFAGVGRSVVVVDMLQASLFVLLRFHLIYSAATPDHFTVDHLLFGQIVALVLFLVATVGCLGAASRQELRFLRVLSLFFGIRLIMAFLANQVSYTWLHHGNSSYWEVPGLVLMSGFAVYLFHTRADSQMQDSAAERMPRPSILVRSLMPSFLALVNLLLGLIILRVSMPLAVASIALSVIFSVARAVLLHTETIQANTFLESRNQQLEDLVNRDPLTGLGNRRSLTAAYRGLQARQGDWRLALLLLDIDSFKQANDQYGHLYGDEILKSLGRKLERIARGFAGSHCARFGGDEFAILLPGASSVEASAFAQELRTAFAAKGFQVANQRVTLSIGIALLPAAREQTLDMLISRADQVLYRAKMLGRNRVEIDSPWESRAEESGSAEPEPYFNLG